MINITFLMSIFLIWTLISGNIQKIALPATNKSRGDDKTRIWRGTF